MFFNQNDIEKGWKGWEGKNHNIKYKVISKKSTKF
jgi:hypothetical protein